MKHLLLFFLFSGSLDGFNQVNADSLLKRCNTLIARCNKMVAEMDEYEMKNLDIKGVTNRDTLRCTLFVYYDRGPSIVHTKPGFVVKQSGKDDIYLDDRKRVIKAPLKVLTFVKE